MAAELTQDSVLRFLQDRGGSVRNSELLAHFKTFLRDHEDQTRHRDLFKQFVNAVASVRQERGVSYVVLRKKLRPGPSPGESCTGRKPELSPRTMNATLVLHGAATGPTPPGDLSKTGKKAPVLRSAGILQNNNNNLETSLNLNLENPLQVSAAYDPTPTDPGSDQNQKTREQLQRGRYCPPPDPPDPPPPSGPVRDVTRPAGPEPGLKPEGVSQQKRGGGAPPRRARLRQSYKTALSYDDDEEEEDEEVPRRPDPSRGLWVLNDPLGQTGRSSSTSSPRISDPPAPPAVASSRRGLVPGYGSEGVPTICIQGSDGERLPVHGPGWSSAVGLAPGPAPGLASGPAPGLALDPGLGPRPSTGGRLSSSSITFSSWTSNEEINTRDGEIGDGANVQEMLQRAKETKRHHVEGEPSSWRHSTSSLLDDRHLRDDHEEVGSSEGSTSSSLNPVVARRLGSKLRGRMSRSLGADLDKHVSEEVVRGGSEAARLNRLHLISSSLSLHRTISSSSLSSYSSTPPRSTSLRDLAEGGELEGGGAGGRRSGFPSSSTGPHDSSYFHRQPLVPLEPREHAWLVKGAAAAWSDVYSLFRDDPSLLNRRDFVSGFTVLHWIAKHGDHRVLNTLWYGVDKAGMRLDVDVRSACGYTPLHLAAIHGHKKMIRLLVHKFQADVGLRDTAGKKPWQYLGRAAPRDLLSMLGAPQTADGVDGGAAGAGRKSRGGEGSWFHHHHHHHSSPSSAEQHQDRPITISGSGAVKRSSSIATFLKHKSLRRFQGHQSDSSI
ncbi:uncharacterized protein sowahb [Diretmus argenteus]